MRTGEIFALTWDNVDFSKRVINVEHDVYCKAKDAKGRWYLSTVKTPNSTRKIYINNTLLKVLVKYKQRQEKLKIFYEKNYHYITWSKLKMNMAG